MVGVDIKPQPHYPFEFHQGDVFDWLNDLNTWSSFDAVHASPPCQDHMMTPHRKHGTGWMLDATRQRLRARSSAWVIENVPGADMRADYKLCGCLFDLPGLRRERWFETSWAGFDLRSPCHHRGLTVTVAGHGTPSWVRQKWGRNPTIADYRAAMGIDWMNRNELSQAIPPAYTEFIGQQLLQHLGVAV